MKSNLKFLNVTALQISEWPAVARQLMGVQSKILIQITGSAKKGIVPTLLKKSPISADQHIWALKQTSAECKWTETRVHIKGELNPENNMA